MLKYEMYRIFSRKIALFLMLLALVSSCSYLVLSGIGDEAVVDRGEVYRYREAIEKDKEIAARYTGVLTESVVRDIWEEYGAPINYQNRNTGRAYLEGAARTGGNDNYSNRLMAHLFAQEMQQEVGDNVFVLREELSDSVYLQGNFIFGYAGDGWGYYWDRFLIVFIVVCVVIIVSLSPGFSEDYALRMADIVLPAARGRGSCWLTRILAGGLFATSYYWLLMGILLLQTFYFYGTEGLSVSCGLTGTPMNWLEGHEPLWKAILMLHLCGWFSSVMLAMITQAVSARCKTTFLAILWSGALYIGPYGFLLIVLEQLPMWTINLWLHQIIFSLPYSYPGMFLNAPWQLRYILTGFAIVFLLAALFVGRRGWSRHQVRS